MPRPLRIEYDGAWYHVMNRGTNHQDIYLSQDHFFIFLNLLEDITKLFHCEIHAYCLMSNHYHLLIRTSIANLGKAMRYLNGVYTQRFNRNENRDGPLFRGRYKAILIENENYLLQVSRYIHLNPVSANICTKPEGYLWSSCRYYFNPNINSHWLLKQYILDMVGKENVDLLYKVYVNDGVDEELNIFYKKKVLPSILGSKEFIDKFIKQLDCQYQKEVSTDLNRIVKLVDSEIVLDMITNYFNIDRKILEKSTPGMKNYPRMLAILLLRQLSHVSHKKIATYLKNIQSHTVSTLLNRADIWSREDEIFKEHLIKLRAYIYSANGM